MFGRRIYLGFGIAGLGFSIALTLSHFGCDVLAPVAMAMAMAAFGVMPLLSRDFFCLASLRLPPIAGPAALYSILARCLAVSAGIVLHLISASISAASVSLLAMLPIGARLDGRRIRSGLALA